MTLSTIFQLYRGGHFIAIWETGLSRVNLTLSCLCEKSTHSVLWLESNSCEKLWLHK